MMKKKKRKLKMAIKEPECLRCGKKHKQYGSAFCSYDCRNKQWAKEQKVGGYTQTLEKQCRRLEEALRELVEKGGALREAMGECKAEGYWDDLVVLDEGEKAFDEALNKAHALLEKEKGD
jgi:hypothetical protein